MGLIGEGCLQAGRRARSVEMGGERSLEPEGEREKVGMLSKARQTIQGLLGSGQRCSHTDQIRDVERGSEGCAKCIALGDTWVHLRMCMTCGQVGCCDSSKNKHAHKHADEVGHPIVRSVEPGEDWMWCYVDEKLVTVGR